MKIFQKIYNRYPGPFIMVAGKNRFLLTPLSAFSLLLQLSLGWDQRPSYLCACILDFFQCNLFLQEEEVAASIKPSSHHLLQNLEKYWRHQLDSTCKQDRELGISISHTYILKYFHQHGSSTDKDWPICAWKKPWYRSFWKGQLL